MSSKSITGQDNLKINTYVLEGKTVSLLLKEFQERIKNQKDEIDYRLNPLIDALSLLVKDISPSLVEKGEIDNVVPTAKEIFELLKEDTKAFDDFFNTLNLCIVDLGTQLRKKTL